MQFQDRPITISKPRLSLLVGVVLVLSSIGQGFGQSMDSLTVKESYKSALEAYSRSNFQTTIHYAETGLKISEESYTYSLIFLNLLGESFLNQEYFPRAIDFFSKIYISGKVSKDELAMGIARYQLGKTYLIMGSSNHAEESFKMSGEHFRNSKFIHGESMVKRALAINKFRSGSYGESKSIYGELLSESNDKSIPDEILLGYLLSEVESLEKEKFKKSEIALFEDSKNPEIQNAFAQYFLMHDDYNNSRKIADDLVSKYPKNPVYHIGLGKVLLESSDFEKALIEFGLANKFARSTDNDRLLIESLYYQSLLSKLSGDSKSTLFFADGTIELSNRYGIYDWQIQAIENKIGVYRESGQINELSETEEYKIVSQQKIRDNQRELNNGKRVIRTISENLELQFLGSSEEIENLDDNQKIDPSDALKFFLEPDLSKVVGWKEVLGIDALKRLENEQELEISRKERLILQQQSALQEAALETADQRQRLFFIVIVFGFFLLLILSVTLWRIYDSKETIALQNENLAKRQKELTRYQAELKSALKTARESGESLNQANIELKAAQSQLIHAEKMSSLGQLTAGIVHEINNPVNFVKGGIDMVDKTLSRLKQLLNQQKVQKRKGGEISGETKEKILKELEFAGDVIPQVLKDVIFGTERIEEIVNGLRIFSRQDEERPSKADVNSIVESALIILRTKYLSKAKIKKVLDEEVKEIDCYPGQLNQVMVNLIGNAIDAISKKGIIEITTKNLGDKISVLISDNGLGINSEVLPHIFDPFFTTKDVGMGTGLGLSISYSIIEKHGGEIKVNSTPGEGSSFEIILNKKLLVNNNNQYVEVSSRNYHS